MRIPLSEAGPRLIELVEAAEKNHRSIELERDGRVVARIKPEFGGLDASELNDFVRSLPPLGDEADAFTKDIEDVRKSFLPEKDYWTED